MKKIILFLMLWSLTGLDLFAQDTIPSRPQPSRTQKERPPLKDRFFIGGNLGLNFGSLTYINISPTIGYRVTEKFGVGLGPSYSYYSDNRDKNYKYSTNTYGGRLFTQYQLLESVLLYSEYEMINVEVPNLLFTKLIRTNVSSLFVGGGYTQQFGRGNSAVSLMLLYNVLESDYNIYENPIIRTGISFGF